MMVAITGRLFRFIQNDRENGALKAFGTTKLLITPLRMNWAPCLHTCAESQTFDARVTVPVVLTPAAADPRLMVTPVCMGSQMVGTGSGMYPVYWLQ
jgi:hypothetical protein